LLATARFLKAEDEVERLTFGGCLAIACSRWAGDYCGALVSTLLPLDFNFELRK